MFSPVPTPEGTKETYWETKAPGSNVLGIGKDVSSGTYIASSVIAALVGAACTAQVGAMPLSGYFSFAVPLPALLSSPPPTALPPYVPIPGVSLPSSHLKRTTARTTRLHHQKGG